MWTASYSTSDVPMTTSGVVLHRPLPGSMTTQNTKTFTTSRMAFATGENTHLKKWENFQSNLVSVRIKPCTEDSTIWIPQQQRHVLLIIISKNLRIPRELP